jgi:hypothetical protein
MTSPIRQLLWIARRRKARVRPNRAFVARFVAGRPAKRTNGSAPAGMTGTRSTQEASAPHARIRWVSPLKSDAYTEYRDSNFLRALGLQQHEGKLSALWPRGGPCWDALARIEREGELVGSILVEAKSHVTEIYGDGCGAAGRSLIQVQAALNETKQWLGVESSVNWLGSLYQSANRYAHLYFLRMIAGLDAYLVNVYFINDSHSPTTVGQWRPEMSEVQRKLGLDSPVPFSAEVFLDALG